MSNLVGLNGKPLLPQGQVAPRQQVDPPKAGTAASFFHRAAMTAVRLSAGEDVPAGEAMVLREIAVQSAICRDLLTHRASVRTSDPGDPMQSELQVSYLLDGQVTADDVAVTLLWAVDMHTAAANGMPSQHAEVPLQRAAMLWRWAGLAMGDDLNTDRGPVQQRAACRLLSTLGNRILNVVAQSGTQLLPMTIWFSMELTMIAGEEMSAVHSFEDQVACRLGASVEKRWLGGEMSRGELLGLVHPGAKNYIVIGSTCEVPTLGDVVSGTADLADRLRFHARDERRCATEPPARDQRWHTDFADLLDRAAAALAV